MKGLLSFTWKLLLVYIVVTSAGALIIQAVGFSTGHPDLLVDTLGKVDSLLDKLIPLGLVGECATKCFE